MSYAQRLVVPITTVADGSATAYSPVVTGKLSQIRYVMTDFAAGVDFTITAEATGENLWTELNVNASATRAPRQATHGNEDGAVALYAAGGAYVRDKIALVNDRVKIVISAGGATKTGTFHLVFE